VGAAVTAALFLGYLRVSWTVAVTSDGAAEALQARDMLAGNWLLHGWTLSDVSFYTTELPEYLLVELIRPFGADVIHVAAAATYTLLVLSVFALARGRARGRAGLFQGLLAAGILLAPQTGYGAFVLLLSPDHVGTEVPLLLGWLLLDRAPRRWWTPASLGLLLAVVQLADRVALITAALPLVLVAAVAAARAAARPAAAAPAAARGSRRRLSISSGGVNPDKTAIEIAPADRKSAGVVLTDRKWGRRSGGGGQGRGARGGRDGWYEIALGLAGVGSIGLAWAGARVLAATGGFTAHPLPFTLAPLGLLWTHVWLTGWGILEVYGANFLGVTGPAGIAFAVLHLAGLAVAVAGTGLALRQFLTRRAGAGLVDSVLAVAVVANLVSYVASIEPGTVIGTGYDAREIAAVLPLGAVLAGRAFGARLARLAQRWRAGVSDRARSISVVVAFALALAGYGTAFGCAAGQPAATGTDQRLADWLAGHGLRYGLGGAAANAVTVDSGARAVVMSTVVRQGRVFPLLYQSAADAYDPRRHDATFLVAGRPASGPGDPAEVIPAAVVRATFGTPAHIYRFAGYTIDTWNVNLLTRLAK
jgi:hypothetical protein